MTRHNQQERMKTPLLSADSIAIVAVAAVFPDAKNALCFWDNIVQGKNVITEIPASRWDADTFYDAYALAPGKTNSRWGGFIELPSDFPYAAFTIKPRIANEMDPQQKILLMTTQQLLDNYSEKEHFKKLSSHKTGVFIGAGFPDFMLKKMQACQYEKINPYTGIGMEDFSLSSRIAYHFGFKGPAMVVKTACSSSLVSVHQAVRALQTHDCDAAIAGGISLMLTPMINICLTKGGFLSPDGKCKTFDANANGYVRSEGCGLVLLKRHEDAVRDGDTILSMIIASAINQDGASDGITAPSGEAQAACYQEALERARISPQQINFLEAHGSGTQLGDTIEMHSIQAVYDQKRASDNPLFVGAVKSTLGHCESAAGIAGLLKTMGVLQHQIIPPNLHYHTPNPNISFKHSAVQLPVQMMRFKKPCEYAAVSSFGVAGTNVHMILKSIKKGVCK